MKLFNTLSQRIDPFEPRGREVSLYVCGITPYDTTHLGHAFTYTSADILVRYLEFKGFKVNYVQNVTDIDDDILRKAKEEGGDWRAIGNRWTTHFIRDMQALNVRPPDFFPRATDSINEIIAMVERLLAQGVAYTRGGSVYFAVDAWSEFGKLSRLPREKMLLIANERGNHPDDPNKHDPLDFVLWQAQAPGEPAWESPWGAGRPGWHIECSTMARHYLGEIVDIHSGGMDLCFPHHECEIAQVEPITSEKPFVRYWMHVAMVHHDGEKMSKSLGNLIMVKDLLETWSPDALRLYLASHHYRQVWEFNWDDLRQAEQAANTLQQAIQASSGLGEPLNPINYKETFIAALDNDLQTEAAEKVLLSLALEVLAGANDGQDVHESQAALRAMSGVFGLQLDAGVPEERVLKGWGNHLERFPETKAIPVDNP